jgi:hypothetical protein
MMTKSDSEIEFIEKQFFAAIDGIAEGKTTKLSDPVVARGDTKSARS